MFSSFLTITLFLLLLLLYSSHPASLPPFNWDNLDMPDIQLNYTTGVYERNFSRYFHHNTMSINTNRLAEEIKASTMTFSQEMKIIRRFENDNQMGHCIFDDFFNMQTFKIKPEVENKFLKEMTDICGVRVEKTINLFKNAEARTDNDLKEDYERIKTECDTTIEEYSIRVLKTYKEKVFKAASHHYDLRPKDAARLKYENIIEKQFVRLGYEFLPIIEEEYTKCSQQYYKKFKLFPPSDMLQNTEESEKDMQAFRDKMFNTTARDVAPR